MSLITYARITSTQVGVGEATQQLGDFQQPVNHGSIAAVIIILKDFTKLFIQTRES
jgi:hypothetical protein